MFGAEWPFTVDSGTVKCEEPGALIFVSNEGDRHYSLNGTAKAQIGYPYPNEVKDIWKFDPTMPAKYKLRISLLPIMDYARTLCR